VCDTDEAAAGEAATSHPPARSTSRLDEVLADDDVRGIVIATPAALHTTVAKQAAAAHKDIFVEKPLAMTYADGLEAVEAAETAGVLMMVGHIFVHHPAVKALRDLVTSGELGSSSARLGSSIVLSTVSSPCHTFHVTTVKDSGIASADDGVNTGSVCSGNSGAQDGRKRSVTIVKPDMRMAGHVSGLPIGPPSRASAPS
jgi:hypothetical protein